MDKLVVRGRKRLTGEVTISGAKNAAVAVIPAAVMATGVSVLENLPSIEDVRNICHTIQEMGGKCRFLDKHTLYSFKFCKNAFVLHMIIQTYFGN